MVFYLDDAIFFTSKRWSNWRDKLRNHHNTNKVCNLYDMVVSVYNYSTDHANKFDSKIYIQQSIIRDIF